MSDGSLSQEEIDALLQDASDLDFQESNSTMHREMTDAQFNDFATLVRETITPMGSSLEMLLGKSIVIGEPQIDRVNGEVLTSNFPSEIVTCILDFNSGAEHGYILEPNVAQFIASSIQGMSNVELDDASINAMHEALQSMFTPLLNTLSDLSEMSLVTNLPTGGIQSKNEIEFSGQFVRISYTLTAAGEKIGNIMEYFSASAVAQAIPSVEQPAPMPQMQQMPQMQPNMQQAAPMPNPAAMQGGPSVMPGNQMRQTATIQNVQFPDMGMSISQSEQGNIGLLMDVSMEMTVELGRTKKLIKDILAMGEGTIIELDKLAGEPVDILVNHKLIAKGEVVVIDENFGVRVTEIISPMERMNTIT